MKKAVFYGRYSSMNQTEQSIEGQLHVCEKYAEQNGLEIIAQYVDRAQSGKTANRKEFQRMITDSEKGMFEAVLVYKLDRFARNRFRKSTLTQNHLYVRLVICCRLKIENQQKNPAEVKALPD